MTRADQLKQVDGLESGTNKEPLQVHQLLNPQVANLNNSDIAGTDAGQGAERRFLDTRYRATEGVDVLMTRIHGQGCKLSCNCVCHAQYRLHSPQFMDALLGSLYIRYSGRFTAKFQCNEYLCDKQSQFRAMLIYSFPQWLLGASFPGHRCSLYQAHDLSVCLTIVPLWKMTTARSSSGERNADLETFSPEILYYYS